MLLAYKDPYKLVRQVLEELGCPEQISKFTGACFTVGVALLMTNLLILPILLQPSPFPIQDMVLEGCDHETVWKGLKVRWLESSRDCHYCF